MKKKKNVIEVLGARVHNLKNIDVIIPRNELVVLTGLSGSGKSSLAFDTIYAEGQRRYLETFSAYARQFLGKLERPDVDKINGLSPVISIEQKTTNKNPRSTVGTVTEIYDFLRLLYARISNAYSYRTGEEMVSYNDDEIIKLILKKYKNKKILILAPVIKSRKGHYRELFEQIYKQGFIKVRVDGEIQNIEPGMKLDRYKTHDIEIVIDRIISSKKEIKRLIESIKIAMKYGESNIIIDCENQSRYFSRQLMCPSTGISYSNPDPNNFSFNSPKGACKKCNGLGKIWQVDEDKIIPNKKTSIHNGAIHPIGEYKNTWIFNQLEAIGKKYNFSLKNSFNEIPKEGVNAILYGENDVFEIKNKTIGLSKTYHLKFDGIKHFIKHQYSDTMSGNKLKRWASLYMNNISCPDCHGSRINIEARHFKIRNKSINELSQLNITKLINFFNEIEKHLSIKQQRIGKEVIKEIKKRLNFLLDIGLDYLSLNRTSKSLSGGEAQRIRLATQIGSKLTGVLYILDEPSIGLHQRDNKKLIKSLKNLRNIGNSILVSEHDKETMINADRIIDIGPLAGTKGGKVIANTTPSEFKKLNTLTSNYLNGKNRIPIPNKRRTINTKKISILGAQGNNLKHVDIEIPLSNLICITGVSGSGKSSLINETLYPALSKHFYKSIKEPLSYKEILNVKYIDKVVDVDQSPIGRTPRSNPATYTGVLSDIRTLFSLLPESKARGYKAGRFSFNVKGGRCESCEGAGLRMIEMNFLPNVHVHCETCNGKRFNRETLEIRYKGKSIFDILKMSINNAVIFFKNHPKILNKINTLQKVGLGYITLGQASTTLSGGEAQRVKLAAELSKRDTGKTLYILDEPTTGLHFEDIRVLLGVLNSLVDKGNTVLIIEHNMDVIKSADYVIDLGPEGGENGGEILCTGTPEEIAKNKKSYTGKYLKEELY